MGIRPMNKRHSHLGAALSPSGCFLTKIEHIKQIQLPPQIRIDQDSPQHEYIPLPA